MRKQLFKILAASFLAVILALNLTSTLTFESGGEDAEARSMDLGESPCWGAGLSVLGGEYTRCTTCKVEKGKVGHGPSSTCTPPME
ncbi:MAG: hypothetical protein FH748_10130 [Balneolaceae bacterium]|nr:hypothetical protein [Balneolaceae bacterium]